MDRYDIIIVGSGLYGAILAYRGKQNGLRCLVLERRKKVGGNVRDEWIDGINVHHMAPIYSIQKMSKYGISSHNSQILSLIFILSWHGTKRSYTTFLSVCTLFMIFMA